MGPSSPSRASYDRVETGSIDEHGAEPALSAEDRGIALKCGAAMGAVLALAGLLALVVPPARSASDGGSLLVRARGRRRPGGRAARPRGAAPRRGPAARPRGAARARVTPQRRGLNPAPRPALMTPLPPPRPRS
jgi:hypothetical protein